MTTIIFRVEINPESRVEPAASKPEKLPAKNVPEKVQRNPPEKVQKNLPEKVQKNIPEKVHKNPPEKVQKNVPEKAPKQSVQSKPQPVSSAPSNVGKKAQEKKVCFGETFC